MASHFSPDIRPDKPEAPPPRLRLIANLWTLWDYPSADRECSLERKIAAIKEAGFHGFSGALAKEDGRLALKHGLSTVGYISSGTPSKFRDLIERNLEGGALRINVQLGDHDTPVGTAVRLAVRMVAEGERFGGPCDIEVHRDTCTEIPEKAYAVAAGFHQVTGRLLPMTGDFSHIAVVKHLAPPHWDRLLVKPRLIQHARQFHFCPFNGHHAQVPSRTEPDASPQSCANGFLSSTGHSQRGSPSIRTVTIFLCARKWDRCAAGITWPRFPTGGKTPG